MSDRHSPALSSVETGFLGIEDPSGAITLPPFWDAAMARYGLKDCPPGFLGISDNVELLMRHMMREPLVLVADKVLRALVTEGEHRVVPAVPDEPANKRSPDYKKWRRSQRAHEFTEGWVNGLQRPLRRVCWHLMESVAFGHKLCEVEFKAEGGSVVPSDLAPKPRTAYRIKVDASNRVLGVRPTSGVETEVVPPLNLLIMSVGGMDDSPTGEPTLAAVYKPWQRREGDFKNQGMSSRQSGGGFLVIEEAYPPQGVPYVDTVDVRQPDDTLKKFPKGEIAAKEASNIVSGRVGKLPPGMTARLLQASGATVFDSALDRSAREIMMCFTGSDRMVLGSDANSQADSGVAEGVALTIRDFYRGLLCSCIEAKFKEIIVLNLGPEYADVVPRYDIATEEGKDLVAVGNFLAGNFDRLTVDQRNVLAAWVGLPDFPEEDETEAIQREADREEGEEAKQFAGRFSVATFATRLDISNEAAQKRVARAVRTADRQFRSLITRFVNGKLSEEEFKERFAYTLATGHDRTYRAGFTHGGGGEELSEEGEEYVATVQASEGEYMLALAEALANGEISEAEALRRASLYANRMRGTANAAFREASVGLGLHLYWDLGPSDHCEECPRYASMSPWEPDELPTTPGEADTPCRANCTCRLRREDGKLGFSRPATTRIASAGDDAIAPDLTPLKRWRFNAPKTIEDAALRIRNDKNERLVIFDADGKVWHKTGSPNRLWLTAEDYEKAAGGKAVHNHPDSTAPSPDDASAAVRRMFAEFSVVHPDGTLITIHQPPSDWDGDPVELNEFLQRAMFGSFQGGEMVTQEELREMDIKTFIKAMEQRKIKVTRTRVTT